MEWSLKEIERNSPIKFDSKLDLTLELMTRNTEILDVSPIQVRGQVSFDDGFYDLNFELSYQITLPSTRSLEPVTLSQNYPVAESYVPSDQKEAADELTLILEGNTLSLDEAVADNVLLEIPSRILSEEEEKAKLPQGKDWQVLSEEEFSALKAKEKKEKSPFGQLSELFSDEDGK